MTIQEKAKAYDKAIEVVNKYRGSHILLTENLIEEIFPALAESEDEKTRKEMIFYFEQEIPQCSIEEHKGYMRKFIAWLEKQGESYTKRDVDDAYLKGITDAKNEIEKQYEANYQIRKDIATFIFYYRGDIKDRAKWMDYLGIKASFVEKQGEQKPVPKFKVGDTMRTLQESKDRWTDGMPFVVSIDSEYYNCNSEKIAIKDQDEYEYPPMNRKHDICDSCDEQKPANWLQELEDKLANATPQQLAEWKEKYFKEEPAEWNEDDREYMESLLDIINGTPSLTPSEVECHKGWLKSLKDRVQPQNTWKPSDAQMDSITCAVRNMKESACYDSELVSLLNDLKKLREE